MSPQSLVSSGIVLGGAQPAPSGSAPGEYDDLINQSAAQYDLDPGLFRRMLTRESGLNPTVVSPKGAKGIAQFMDPTAQEYGIDPFNPQQAIPTAAKHLRRLMGPGSTDYPTGFASYNWGQGNVQRQGLANAPPETVDYVNWIMGRQVLGGMQQPAAAVQAPAPANDQPGAYPTSYTQADGTVVNLSPQPEMAAQAQPELRPSGIVLGQAPAAQQAPQVQHQELRPTGIILSPLGKVPQIGETPPGWGQQPQEAPPTTAADIPLSSIMGQPPVDLAKTVPNDFADPNRKADPATPWRREPGWAETLSQFPQRFVPSAEKAAGGALQFLGQNQLGSGIAGPGVTTTPEELQQRPKVAAEMAKSAGTPGTMANLGQRMSEEAQKAILAHTPNVPHGSAKYYADLVAGGVLNTVPALVGSIASGNPAPIIIDTAARTFGTTYADEIKKNPNDPHGAATRAGALATIDAAAAAIGIKAFNYQPFRTAAGTVTQDITGEVAQVTRQSISDTIKNLTIQGLGVQPAISVVNHGVDNIVNGRPVTEGLPEAYVTGALQQTLVLGLTHAFTSPKARVGEFKKPMGEAYPFNPEGLEGKFPGQEIDAQFTGGRPKPQTMQLPAPPSKTAPATTSTGEKSGPLSQTGSAPVDQASAAPSTSVEPVVGLGGPPITTGKPGDQAGGVGPSGLSGSGVSATGAKASGPVPAAAPAEQPKAAAFVGPETAVTGEPTTKPVVAPAAPVAGQAPGTKGEIRTTTGESVPVDYHVVDMSQVAHPAAGDPLQPRNRETSASSAAQVGKIAGNLDPRQLMTGDTADIGPPVVNQQGTLLAGNGRFAAIKTAAENHPEKYQAYVDAIKAAGHEIPPGVQQPVLVRRTGEMTPEAQLKLARDSNVSRSMAMSAVEQAHVDAANISDEMMARYVPGDSRSEQAWLKTLPETERAALIDVNGRNLSKVGEQRLKGAMLAKAYGGGDLLRRALEDPSDDTRGITNSMAEVAPQWAKMKARIAADEIPKDFDITKQLTQALDMVRQQRESRGTITPHDMVSQLDLDRGPLDPITEQLYRSFYNDGMTRLNSAKGLTGILHDYLRAAHNYTAQESFPGMEPAKIEPAQILKGIRSGTQEALFEKPGDEIEEDDTEDVPDTRGQKELVPDEEEGLSASDQALLDQANDQIAKLQANPKGKEDQIAKRIAFRDALLAKKGRRRVNRKVDLAPKKHDAAPKTFEDYKFQKGTPNVRDAFVEHRLTMGDTLEQAESYAQRVMNMGIEHQIEVLRNQVKDKFGFQEVTVVGERDRFDMRNSLLEFHHVAQNMMNALAFPSEMASLMGTTKLVLEPLTPRAKAFGSYHPGTKEITLYGRSNVFGHEWTHAFDHYIVDALFQIKNPHVLASALGRRGSLDPNDPMTARMGNLLNAMFHQHADLALKMIDLQIKAQAVNKAGDPTPSAKKAKAAIIAIQSGAIVKGVDITPSQYRLAAAEMGDKYWLKVEELLARAGEAYLAQTMTQQGIDPRGVVMPDEAYLSNNGKRLRMTFPKESERMEIFKAFDHLMDGFRDTALHGSIPAARASEIGLSDPANWAQLNTHNRPLAPLKTLYNRVRNWRQTLNRTKLTDPNLPDPGSRNILKRAQILAIQELWTRMGILEAMHNMAPDTAKGPLQDVMDRLGHTPGSGRYTGWDSLEERSFDIANEAMRKFSNSLDNAGFDPQTMTKEDKDHLRHAMTTGDKDYPVDPLDPNSARVPISAAVNKVATELRKISDDLFQMLKDANIPIGYAKSGHFMRLYDEVKAYQDKAGFIKAASVLYRGMFDKEVGDPGENPAELLAKWNELNAQEKEKAASPDSNGGNQHNALMAASDGMAELKRNLAKQKKLEAEIAAAGGVANQKQRDALDKLEKEAEYLASTHHDAVGDYIADINATIWHQELTTNYANEFGKSTPGGRFLNARTLPPEADRIMRDYMNTDPLQVLPHYYESASRKIAYAEAFGVGGKSGKGDKYDALIKAMEDGGLHPEDVDMVKHIIESVSGGTNNSQPRSTIALANSLHASASVALMGRAAYTMAAEPFVGALHTGEMRTGFKNLVGAMGQFLRTASARERAELADLLGVTRSAFHEEILMMRARSRYSDSINVGKFMAQYYMMNWVSQMTRGSKRGSVAGHDWYLRKLSRDTLDLSNRDSAADRRDEARRMFNELGIPETLQAGFSQWLAGVNGLPNLHAPENAQWASTYARAMRRLSGRTIIETKKMEKQLASDDKWRGLMYQFLQYANGMQRNVLEVMVARLKRTYERNYERDRARGKGKFRSHFHAGWKTNLALGATAATVIAFIMAGLPQTIFREYMFNHNKWLEHEEAGDLHEWLWELATARSGTGGMLQMPAEIITQLRYDAQVAGAVMGAALKWDTKNLSDVVSGIFNPEGKKGDTNSRQFAMVRGLFNLTGMPLGAYIATRLSAFGSLATVAAGGFYQYFSSPQFADTVATYFAGPKGTKIKEPKLDEDGEPIEEDDDDEDEDEDEDEDTDEGEAGTKPGKEGISGSQSAGAVPWGLVDDFIAPMWKVVRPAVGMIPGWAKIGGAVGGLGWAGLDFWNNMEKFRNAPTPKPKKAKEEETEEGEAP
jgi:hypothetical protein